MFNFPDTPSPGSIYTPSGGPEYTYSGGAWVQTGWIASSGPVTGAVFFNSKVQASMSFIAADVQSVTLHGYSTPGDFGGAHYVKVVSEPTHNGKFQSGDGAWWEIKEPILTPQMFGAVADGVTDDYQAIVDAIDSKTTANTGAIYVTGPVIHFPDAMYYIGSTIELKKSVKLTGNASGLATGSPAELVFAPDTTGFIIHRFNTPVGPPASTAADSTMIEGLRISSSGTDPDAHGIWMRARAVIRNCYIERFPGDGLHIVAATSGPSIGNADCFYLEALHIVQCGRNGIRADFNTANAGLANNINVTANGRYGIWDSSFHGNTWIGVHSSQNGVSGVGNNSSIQSSFVTDGVTGRYTAHPNATEAQLVATAPGTDATVWVSTDTGGVHAVCPLWTAAQPEGTYFGGGCYRSEGGNACAVFVGCYTEGGQGGLAFDGLTMVLGGSIYGAGRAKGGYTRGTNGNGFSTVGSGALVAALGDTVQSGIGGYEAEETSLGTALAWHHKDDATANIWRLKRTGADWVINRQNSGNIMKFTGELTTEEMGTGVVQPYFPNIPILALGSSTNMRKVTTGSSAPASGAHARGEIVYNVNPSASGKIGWVCTASGTPGTWNTWGAIDP